MCQAIVKPKGILIDQETLRLAWQANSDGAGFAVKLPHSTVEIKKGFFKFKKFWKVYKEYESLDCLIHFRLATHGCADEVNCHPFPLGDNAAMIHNGILSRFLPHAIDARSDTRLLIEDFLVPSIRQSGLSPHEFFAHAGTKALILSLIGSNKLAALTSQGFTIFNEGLGEWSQGAWYSAGKPSKLTYWERYQFGGSGHSRGGYSYLDTRDPYIDDCDDAYWERDWQKWADRKEESIDMTAQPVSMCTLCEASPSRLYQVGADYLCDACWLDYTTPTKHLS